MEVLITCWQRQFDSLEWEEASCSITSLSYICSQVGSKARVEIEVRDDEITIFYISGEDIADYQIEVTCNSCDREEVIQRLTEAASLRRLA